MTRTPQRKQRGAPKDGKRNVAAKVRSEMERLHPDSPTGSGLADPALARLRRVRIRETLKHWNRRSQCGPTE